MKTNENFLTFLQIGKGIYVPTERNSRIRSYFKLHHGTQTNEGTLTKR